MALNDIQLIALRELGHYAETRSTTSNPHLDHDKKMIVTQAMRVFFLGGNKAHMLTSLSALKEKNRSLRGFWLNRRLGKLIERLKNWETNPIFPLADAPMLALENPAEGYEAYAQITLLGNYLHNRHSSQAHDQHKLSMVKQTARIMFLDLDLNLKIALLDEVIQRDVEYEKSRGEFYNFARGLVFSSGLQKTLKKIKNSLIHQAQREIVERQELLSPVQRPFLISPQSRREPEPSAPALPRASDELTFEQRLENVGANSDAAPNEYLCPITQELMSDPVIIGDGHTYERSAIENWFLTHNTSPKTNELIEDTSLLFPNRALRSLISTFVEHYEAANQVDLTRRASTHQP